MVLRNFGKSLSFVKVGGLDIVLCIELISVFDI